MADGATDAGGQFVGTTLAPGTATVDVNLPGFRPVSGAQVPLRPDCTTALTVVLRLGTLSERSRARP